MNRENFSALTRLSAPCKSLPCRALGERGLGPRTLPTLPCGLRLGRSKLNPLPGVLFCQPFWRRDGLELLRAFGFDLFISLSSRSILKFYFPFLSDQIIFSILALFLFLLIFF